VADALALVGYSFMHVHQLPGNTAPIPGQCDLDDSAIAIWCGKANRVLVTCDQDFRTRWLKSGLLAREGVEVIVFSRNIAGLAEQHRRVTLHLPDWIKLLEQQGYGHRVWEQPTRGLLRLRRS
jgi:hypothetical protein